MAVGVSKTTIANLALSHLRNSAVITNLDTDLSTEALTAKLWYNPSRRQALVDFDLGFSRKRLTLATHGEAPSADWAFRYQWPADCLIPRSLQNPLGRQQPPLPFSFEQADDGTQSILASTDGAILIYTRDAMDTTFFTPHFVLGHSYLLAHYMAGSLTGKTSVQNKMIENYNNASNVGAAHEANVTAPGTQTSLDPDWIRGR